MVGMLPASAWRHPQSSLAMKNTHFIFWRVGEFCKLDALYPVNKPLDIENLRHRSQTQDLFDPQVMSKGLKTAESIRAAPQASSLSTL